MPPLAARSTYRAYGAAADLVKPTAHAGRIEQFTLCLTRTNRIRNDAACGRPGPRDRHVYREAIQGTAVEAFVDQKTRTPRGLSRSFGLA